MKCLMAEVNFSEGRDQALIDQVRDAMLDGDPIDLMEISSDADHNRTVFTFKGEPRAVLEATKRLSAKAVELIDMTKHTGAHPRIGAVDVVPFIPVKDVTIDEALEICREYGKFMGGIGVPVYYYEDAATCEERKSLPKIRKGQFEGMAEKVQQPEWEPDFGGRRIHPTAGVVAVGARMPLVAFNINLSTSDVEIATKIAKIIRRINGGFDCVKAMGVMLEERNLAQVSINMTDFNRTPLYRVLELVKAEAARWGVHVVGTEIVGLTPMKALIDSAEYYMQIEAFDFDKQVLENHIL